MPNPYESAQYLSDYLLFHYGRPKQLCDWPFAPKGVFDFHRRIARQMVHGRGRRALDLGCAVGRLSYELSRRFDEVIGVDKSRAFIKAAKLISHKNRLEIQVAGEGGLLVPRKIALPKGVRKRNVCFEVGDAQKLRRDIGSFDLVVMANLIDRLPDPKKCFRRLPALVKAGGRLVITSPYSWLEEYTPKSKWLGRGRRGRMLETLQKLLRPHFRLAKRRDLPFLIREHRRKYEFVIAEATAWERVDVFKKWRGKGQLPGGISVDAYLKRVRDADSD